MNIVFNHSFRLKHDQKRTYIIAVSSDSGMSYLQGWVSKIHPIYAMIFSFISLPMDLTDAVKKIAYFLDVNNNDINVLLKTFLESKEPFMTEYKGFKSFFPPGIIKETDGTDFAQGIKYDPSQFIYNDIDVQQERCISSPIGLVYMVTNRCATNCLYCYADKKTNPSLLSIEEVRYFCKDAKENGIPSITLSGGEVFMHPRWYELLKAFIDYGFKPDLISTKVPLTEDTIIKIKELNIKIQISLDAFDSTTLSKILNVKSDYFEKIKQTILNLDRYGIDFQIATVITNINDEIRNLEYLHVFIKKLKNLTRWEIRIAFRSLYSRDDFDTFKVSQQKTEELETWVKSVKINSPVNILWVPNSGKKYRAGKEGSRSFMGSRCSANFSHMVILPDGKVTICEQLYWNPRFIIGNIKNNSISEIWNSPRALYLANIPQSNIREDNVCSDCTLYSKCSAYPNKCYADVLKAYGDDNWDFPDPRCNKAPQFINSMN